MGCWEKNLHLIIGLKKSNICQKFPILLQKINFWNSCRQKFWGLKVREMSFLRRAKLLKFLWPTQGFGQGLQGLDQVTEKNRIPIPGPEISDEVSVDKKSRDVSRDGVGESGERIDLQRGSDADQEVGVAFVRFLQRHGLVSPYKVFLL